VTFTFLDVSKHQGTIDWRKVADTQIEGQYVRGAIIRAIDASGVVDPFLSRNLREARDTGRLWTGAYHNLVNGSVTGQFRQFRTVVPEWRGVVPMVDSEQGASFAQLQQFMELARLQWGTTPTGKIKCLVYLPKWYWGSLPDRKPLPSDWVWVHSDYPPYGTPFIPPVKTIHGHVWQYTNKGVVPGITENTVDLNRAYMDEASFLQLVVQ
jgi:lysozyme